MWKLKPVHEEFARNFYGTSGFVVPGVMALDGKPMGAWYQYTLAPTNGAWVAQSFYGHWRYTMDQQFLKERAYPYCSGIAEGLAGLMKPGKNGKLKLALSSSPEIHNNTQQAWLTPNSNFDLSLIRWIFEVNTEMANALNLENEAIRWQDLLAKMDDIAVEGDDGRLLISPDESLKESHRHFSHLMAIHPLGILNTEGTDRDRKIIKASLEQIDSLGTKFWCGYSFSWMACMQARVGKPEIALENLKDYMDCTSRNGFHLNGVQTRKDLPAYNMRAFTLEGNFAAGQAVNEMLLQSWGGRIRIFPAVPEKWADVSFQFLRAEGGFVIDAERKHGKTVKVKITATVEQPLRLKDPFGKQKYDSNIDLERNDTGDFICLLKKDQTLLLEVSEK
jgi:alpha-L-fucosidase 2